MYPTQRKAEIAGNQAVGRGEIQSYTVAGEGTEWTLAVNEWDGHPSDEQVAIAIRGLGEKGRANALAAMKQRNFNIKTKVHNMGKAAIEKARLSNQKGRDNFLTSTTY